MIVKIQVVEAVPLHIHYGFGLLSTFQSMRRWKSHLEYKIVGTGLLTVTVTLHCPLMWLYIILLGQKYSLQN